MDSKRQEKQETTPSHFFLTIKKKWKKKRMTYTEPIMIETYPINPKIQYIRMAIDDFKLGAEDCWVVVKEYDKDDFFLNLTRVYVPPEVYAEWSTDDDYIVDYAMDYIGFVRKKPFTIFFNGYE